MKIKSLEEKLNSVGFSFDTASSKSFQNVKLELEKAIIEFDKNRNFSQNKPDKISKAEQERDYFVSKFPSDKILQIKIDDYVQGKTPTNSDSFSTLVEFGTKNFGRVGGGSAWKHGVFVKKETQEYQYYKKHYNSIDEAYSSLLEGIDQIVKAGKQFSIDGDYSKLEKVAEGKQSFLSLPIIAKILTLYYPYTFIHYWSHQWINDILEIFKVSSDQYEENSGFYKKQKILLDIKENHLIMKNWNNWYFSDFISSILYNGIHLGIPGDNSLDTKILANRILEEQFPLAIDIKLVERVLRHLKSGKHVILVGAPGVGKSVLAKRILSIFGKQVTGNEGIISVASPEWTRRELIGGVNLQNQFDEGYVVKAAKNNQWLLIDEFNRADINKAFGEMFLAIEDNKIKLRPGEGSDDTINIPLNFRMIGTMNDFDKNLLLTELSYGLITRFAFIDIIPDFEKEQSSIKEQLRDNNKIDEDNFDSCKEQINKFFEFIKKVREKRMIGVRTTLDIVRYVVLTTIEEPENKWEHLDDALCDYLLIQFDRLDKQVIDHVQNSSKTILGENASKFNDGITKMQKQLEHVSSFLSSENESTD